MNKQEFDRYFSKYSERVRQKSKANWEYYDREMPYWAHVLMEMEADNAEKLAEHSKLLGIDKE